MVHLKRFPASTSSRIDLWPAGLRLGRAGSRHQQIRAWWHSNAAGPNQCDLRLLFGQAQRLLHGISEGPGLFLTHGAVDLNEVYRQQGISLPDSISAAQVKDKETLGRALVICPPAVVGTPWFKRFVRPVVAMASGWMSIRGQKNERNGSWLCDL